MENLDLNQGVLCEIENTEYGTVVTFPADLNLQALTGPLHLYGSSSDNYSGEHQELQEDVIVSERDASDDHEDDGRSPRRRIGQEETLTTELVHQGDCNINTKDSIIDGGDDDSSFPELGSIIELETDTTACQEVDDNQRSHRPTYDYHSQEPVPKKWDTKKTLALIKCLKKHQYYFKNGSVQRITLWNEISEELSKKGFDECNRDECRKKWDNLYRTYKKINQRDSDKVTWELHEPVKEAVKCLAWEDNYDEDFKRRKRGGLIHSSSELNVVQKIMKLNEEFHETVTQRHVSFFEEFNILEEEKKSILSKINELMMTNTCLL